MSTQINKLLKILKITDEDDEEFADEDFYDTEERAQESYRKNSAKESRVQESTPSYSERTNRSSDSSFRSKPSRSERTPINKVVPIKSGKGRAPWEVCIHKPTDFNDAAEICNLLLEGRPVIVNLEGFNSYDAQRIMDFICGCIHALDGSLRQISKFIFIFSPNGVEISGDITFDVNGVPTFKGNI